MHNVNTHYAQRWHHLCSQASEQRSNTNIINQQVIIDSTSNVIVLSGKQANDVLMQVNMSDSTMRL